MSDSAALQVFLTWNPSWASGKNSEQALSDPETDKELTAPESLCFFFYLLEAHLWPLQ